MLCVNAYRVEIVGGFKRQLYKNVVVCDLVEFCVFKSRFHCAVSLRRSSMVKCFHNECNTSQWHCNMFSYHKSLCFRPVC